MSIADKLTQVAENTPRVYAAGERAGYKKCEEEYNEEFSFTGSLVEVSNGMLEVPYNIISIAEPSNRTIDFMHCGWWTKSVIDLSPYTVWDKWYIRASNGVNYISTTNQKAIRDYIPVAHLRGLTLTLNHPVYEYNTGYSGGVCFYTGKSESGFISGTSKGLIQVPDNAVYMRMSWNPDYDASELQFELGESITDFEPYSGRWISETLPPNIAGATYNWNTGALTKTHHGDKLSDFEWNYNEDNGYYWATMSGAKNNSTIMLGEFVQSDYWHIRSGGYAGEEIEYAIDVDDPEGMNIVIAIPYGEDFFELLDNLQPYLITNLDTPETIYFPNCPAGKREESMYFSNSLGLTTVSNHKTTDTDLKGIHEAGTNAGWSDLLNAVTDYGARTDYECGFYRWNCEYIRPQYKVVPTSDKSGYYTFSYNTKLKILESKHFDFSKKTPGSNATNDYGYFVRGCSSLEKIEDIGIQAPVGYVVTFYNCPKLHTIEVLRSSAATTWNTAFSYCSSLKNLKIEGEIGKNGFNVAACPLTHESLMSIINALVDKTGDTSTTWTITLGSTNLAQLTDAEKAIATTRGWTLA